MIASSPRGIIRSSAMQEVANRLSAAIQPQGGVLLCGEPGTGRATLARAIHTATHGHFEGSVERLLRASMRSAPNGQPFVVFDCGMTPDLEKQLFGCESFGSTSGLNGLDRIKEGSKLHQAFNGTAVFCQIPEMPGGLQVRLARILRDGQVWVEDTRGEVTQSHVAIKAIATIDLPIVEERLLPELRKRLGQTVISLPPLRDRREDIPSLVRYIVRDICAQQNLPKKIVSVQAMQLLSALPWRGNIKELSDLLQILVPRASGRLIRVADVLAHTRLAGGADTFVYSGPLKEARERFERDYVAAVLAQHHGRMADAAKALGIQRTNLYRKVRQLALGRKRAGHWQ